MSSVSQLRATMLDLLSANDDDPTNFGDATQQQASSLLAGSAHAAVSGDVTSQPSLGASSPASSIIGGVPPHTTKGRLLQEHWNRLWATMATNQQELEMLHDESKTVAHDFAELALEAVRAIVVDEYFACRRLPPNTLGAAPRTTTRDGSPVDDGYESTWIDTDRGVIVTLLDDAVVASCSGDVHEAKKLMTKDITSQRFLNNTVLIHDFAFVPLTCVVSIAGCVCYVESWFEWRKQSLQSGIWRPPSKHFASAPPVTEAAVSTSRSAEFATRSLSCTLCLRPHVIAGVATNINADAQVHLGDDGRLYLRYLRRLTPPVQLQLDGTIPTLHTASERLGTLRLRPELLSQLSPGLMLSSDAFARGSRAVHDMADEGIFTASALIRDRAIPDVARRLALMEVASPHYFRSIALGRVKGFLHHHGINVKYLGLVTEWCERYLCLGIDRLKSLLIEAVEATDQREGSNVASGVVGRARFESAVKALASMTPPLIPSSPPSSHEGTPASPSLSRGGVTPKSKNNIAVPSSPLNGSRRGQRANARRATIARHRQSVVEAAMDLEDGPGDAHPDDVFAARRTALIQALQGEMVARAARDELFERWRDAQRQYVDALRENGTVMFESEPVKAQTVPLKRFLENVALRFLTTLSGDGMSFVSEADRSLWEDFVIPRMQQKFGYSGVTFRRQTAAARTTGGGAVDAGMAATRRPVASSLIMRPTNLETQRVLMYDAIVSTVANPELDVLAQREPGMRAEVRREILDALRDPDDMIGQNGVIVMRRSHADTATVGGADLASSGVAGAQRSSVASVLGVVRLDDFGLGERLHEMEGLESEDLNAMPTSAVILGAMQDPRIATRVAALSGVLVHKSSRTLDGVDCRILGVAKSTAPTPLARSTYQLLRENAFDAVDRRLGDLLRLEKRRWALLSSAAAEMRCVELTYQQYRNAKLFGRAETAFDALKRLKEIYVRDISANEPGLAALLIHLSVLEQRGRRVADAVETAQSALTYADSSLPNQRLVLAAIQRLLDAIDGASGGFEDITTRRRKQSLLQRLTSLSAKLRAPMWHIDARAAMMLLSAATSERRKLHLGLDTDSATNNVGGVDADRSGLGSAGGDGNDPRQHQLIPLSDAAPLGTPHDGTLRSTDLDALKRDASHVQAVHALRKAAKALAVIEGFANPDIVYYFVQVMVGMDPAEDELRDLDSNVSLSRPGSPNAPRGGGEFGLTRTTSIAAVASHWVQTRWTKQLQAASKATTTMISLLHDRFCTCVDSVVDRCLIICRDQANWSGPKSGVARGGRAAETPPTLLVTTASAVYSAPPPPLQVANVSFGGDTEANDGAARRNVATRTRPESFAPVPGPRWAVDIVVMTVREWAKLFVGACPTRVVNQPWYWDKLILANALELVASVRRCLSVPGAMVSRAVGGVIDVLREQPKLALQQAAAEDKRLAVKPTSAADLNDEEAETDNTFTHDVVAIVATGEPKHVHPLIGLLSVDLAASTLATVMTSSGTVYDEVWTEDHTAGATLSNAATGGPSKARTAPPSLAGNGSVAANGPAIRAVFPADAWTMIGQLIDVVRTLVAGLSAMKRRRQNYLRVWRAEHRRRSSSNEDGGGGAEGDVTPRGDDLRFDEPSQATLTLLTLLAANTRYGTWLRGATDLPSHSHRRNAPRPPWFDEQWRQQAVYELDGARAAFARTFDMELIEWRLQWLRDILLPGAIASLERYCEEHQSSYAPQREHQHDMWNAALQCYLRMYDVELQMADCREHPATLDEIDAQRRLLATVTTMGRKHLGAIRGQTKYEAALRMVEERWSRIKSLEAERKTEFARQRHAIMMEASPKHRMRRGSVVLMEPQAAAVASPTLASTAADPIAEFASPRAAKSTRRSDTLRHRTAPPPSFFSAPSSCSPGATITVEWSLGPLAIPPRHAAIAFLHDVTNTSVFDASAVQHAWHTGGGEALTFRHAVPSAITQGFHVRQTNGAAEIVAPKEKGRYFLCYFSMVHSDATPHVEKTTMSEGDGRNGFSHAAAIRSAAVTGGAAADATLASSNPATPMPLACAIIVGSSGGVGASPLSPPARTHSSLSGTLVSNRRPSPPSRTATPTPIVLPAIYTPHDTSSAASRRVQGSIQRLRCSGSLPRMPDAASPSPHVPRRDDSSAVTLQSAGGGVAVRVDTLQAQQASYERQVMTTVVKQQRAVGAEKVLCVVKAALPGRNKRVK